ncbi:collagen-like protein [Flavobacteriaceae bacterium 3-367]|uniref:collagen-like triple helix repeat-containing protein n=1 Tax=Eudoraea algarum TaxID=3417568 RepID=UPI0032854E42
MKKAMRFLMLGTMVLAMVLTSCSAEDGEDGAIGPQGPQGIAGTDGVDGVDGNANVIYSEWVDFVAAEWSALSSDFGIDVRNYPVVANDLTQNVLNNGVVLLYVRFIGFGDDAIITPFTGGILSGVQTIFHHDSEALITIKFINSDGVGDPGTFGGSGNAFRYILVPGSQLASKGFSKQDFEKMSYYEVMDHFGLEY